MAAIGGIPHKCCCYCHTNWRHHCHGLGPRAYLFITFRRNISAWIGVRSRDLLNICENDISWVKYIFPQELIFVTKVVLILFKMSRPDFFESWEKLRIYRRLKRVMKGLFFVLNELLPGQELATCVRQCHAANCLPGSKRSKFCPRSGNRGNLWFYCTFQNPFGNPILFYKLTGVKSHK